MEALIKKALGSDPIIAPMLATWNGEPAVFYQTAPPDKDRGWSRIQYPRVDYAVDWTYNPERKADGACQINVWCLNNGETAFPEDIGDAIRESLRDLFIIGADGELYSLEWQRTDGFEAGGQNEPLTIGVTLSFDILAFPNQQTVSPDPVAGLNTYIKAIAPDVLVAGVDVFPELFRPLEDRPVVYVRLVGDISAMRNSYAVAWMDVSLAVHIFAPHPTMQKLAARQITNRIALDGECKLDDGSPMLIQRVAINTGANPLRQGQITISGRYGVLREPEKAPLLNNPTMRGEFQINGN